MFNARALESDTQKWLASKLLPKQYGKAAEEQNDDADKIKSLAEKLIDKLADK